MFTKIAIAAASAAAALVAVAPAGAATPAFADGVTRSVVVNYVDLNLAQPAGQDELGARIRRAAASVCGAPGRQLELIRVAGTCRIAAAADAHARMAVVVASNDLRGGTLRVVAR